PYLLVPPRPPPSSLFPYTTLFRSRPSSTSASSTAPICAQRSRSIQTSLKSPYAIWAPSTWQPTSSRTRMANTCSTTKSSSAPLRSEEHTSELQSRENLVCRLLLEK